MRQSRREHTTLRYASIQCKCTICSDQLVLFNYLVIAKKWDVLSIYSRLMVTILESTYTNHLNLYSNAPTEEQGI